MLSQTQLTVVAAVLAAAAIAFAVLWLLGRWRLRSLRSARSETEWTRIDRELDLAEQTARLRIIRELQDVAIQSVARLASEAEGIRFTSLRDAEAADRRAVALARGARDALAEMRRVLTVVRQGERVVAPQPSLASMRELFDIMRTAGLELSFSESGHPFDLREGAELSVFRIVQGALENALTHGGAGTRVTVGFAWTGDGLSVSVGDDGVRAAARREGHDRDATDRLTRYSIDDDLAALTEELDGPALTEMRERAELYGGVLNAHTVPGVGFMVTSVFPTLRTHNGVHGVDLSPRAGRPRASS